MWMHRGESKTKHLSQTYLNIPGIDTNASILIKTDTIYLFTWFPSAVRKTWFSQDYKLLPGAYSRETTVFFPDLTFAFRYAYVIHSTALLWTRR